MATLPPIMTFTPPRRVRVYATTAAKGGGANKEEEKGLFDWILGSLAKEDQFYETDPLLNKVEGKSGSGTVSSGRNKNTVSVPQKKKNGGGFGLGGLFAKND